MKNQDKFYCDHFMKFWTNYGTIKAACAYYAKNTTTKLTPEELIALLLESGKFTTSQKDGKRYYIDDIRADYSVRDYVGVEIDRILRAPV